MEIDRQRFSTTHRTWTFLNIDDIKGLLEQRHKLSEQQRLDDGLRVHTCFGHKVLSSFVCRLP